MNKKIRALLVEDNMIAQKIASMVLIEVGCDVDTASNGESALNLFKTNHYDIIFMDIGLPDTNGFAVTKIIRALEEKVHICIVGLTAHNSDEYKKQASEAGMNGYITKPLAKETVEEYLNQLTRN